MGKTNAEHCKNYYNRKKAAKEAEKIRQGLSVEKPIKKTGAERTRAYRLRKKMLSQANESLTRETSLPLKSYHLRSLNTSRTPTTENGNDISQGETSQDAVTLRNSSDPCIQTQKISIKEEIDVDEEEWKLGLQEKKEIPSGNIEWMSSGLKIEPEEEDEELEPVASVTIPSLHEDLLEEY